VATGTVTREGIYARLRATCDEATRNLLLDMLLDLRRKDTADAAEK
jgi:hypothetical protein